MDIELQKLDLARGEGRSSHPLELNMDRKPCSSVSRGQESFMACFFQVLSKKERWEEEFFIVLKRERDSDESAPKGESRPFFLVQIARV